MPTRRLLFLLVLTGLCTTPGRAGLQVPGVGALQPSSAQQPAVIPDPLGRDNPRGCVLGFIRAAQEGLLLSVMESLEKAGAVVALPTQTTMVNQDSWVDPEKAKAAKAAIEKVRDPGVPGPQKLPPTA